MLHKSANPPRILIALAALVLLCALSAPAQSSQELDSVVAVVNNQTILASDLDLRSKCRTCGAAGGRRNDDR